MQDKLTSDAVCRYILDRYDHPEKLAKMADRMRSLATPDAAARVADLVESGA